MRHDQGFGQIFVKVSENGNSEDDVNLDVTFEFIDKFRNMGCDPPVLLSGWPILYAAIVIYKSVESDGVQKAIDAFVPFSTAAGLPCKVISAVCHKVPNFTCQSRIIFRKLRFTVLFICKRKAGK
jgi:hypothetical protein